MTFSLDNILKEVDLSRYSSIREVLSQRWRYSHYIHGRVAWEHGLRCGYSEAQSFRVGMALELGWASVLLLDDILDEDEVRFHAPAAWLVNGVGVTAMEAGAMLIKSVSLLNRWPSVLHDFSCAVEETEVASKTLKKIDYGMQVSEIEPLVFSLGAMSVFATSWAIPDSGIGKVAGYETCAGQLVNDCNDCLGAKAIRRNYPDLRTHQPTLLSQLLVAADQTGELRDLFENVTLSDVSSLSARIRANLQKDNEVIFSYFDSCMARALVALDNAKNVPEREYAGARDRIANHAKSWREKIERLITA